MVIDEGHVWNCGPLQIKLLHPTCGQGHILRRRRYETLMVSWRLRYVTLRFTWGASEMFKGYTVPRPVGLCGKCLGIGQEI